MPSEVRAVSRVAGRLRRNPGLPGRPTPSSSRSLLRLQHLRNKIDRILQLGVGIEFHVGLVGVIEFPDADRDARSLALQPRHASKFLIRLLGKLGKETASAIRDILVDIASEAAKKMLMPGK